MSTLRRLRRASCSSGVSWLRAGASFSPLARLLPRLGSGLSSGMTSPSPLSSSMKSSVSAPAFLAGRPGRRPVDFEARALGAVSPSALAAVFLAAVFLAAVFLAAVFLAAVFFAAAFFATVLLAAFFAAVFLAAVFAAAPPSTFSPTFTESESASPVAATVLVCLTTSSAALGETRVSLVIVAFRRRRYTGRARGHHSLLR